MEWWLWMIVGLVFLGLEVMAPGGFVLLFFGLGALLVGALVVFGFGGSTAIQWVLWAVFSTVLLVLIRGRIVKYMQSSSATQPPAEFIGESASILTDITPGQTGKVELRGSSWSAKNIGDKTLAGGQQSIVVAVDGLTLHVK